MFEVLRFSYTPLNYAVFLAVLSLPLVIVFVGSRFPRTWMRVVTLVSMLPLVLLSVLLVLVTLLFLLLVVLELGKDPTFEKVRSVEAEHYRVSVYRVNVTGATGGFDVEVRQEKPLLPGLLLVHNLYASSGADAEMSFVNQDRIKVRVPASKRHEEQEREFELKRFVYF